MPQRKPNHFNKRKAGDSPTISKRRIISRDVDDVEDHGSELTVQNTSCHAMYTTNVPKECDGNAREDDEEEAWLDALEKGDLDDYGELKKEKDPNLLTARQKALKERTSTPSKPLISNTMKVEIMSEEAQKKKAEKNKRRKLQAVRKAEENQKQTIERLVKQQGARGSKERQRKSMAVNDNNSNVQPAETKSVPMIKYHSKGNMLFLSFPEDFDIPIKSSKPSTNLKPKPKCVICGNGKRYNCSKTGMPICSLKCYKDNLANIRSTVPLSICSIDD